MIGGIPEVPVPFGSSLARFWRQERLLRRIEIMRAEFGKNLAGSKNMAPHGGDHRSAFCLGRVEI